MENALTTDKKRVEILDAWRGAAILFMVIYHILFDLDMLGFEWASPIFESQATAEIFDAATFIAIAGLCCSLSRSNALRGAQLLCVSVLMTAGTMIVDYRAPITFGVLHLLSISMLVWAAGEKFFKKLPKIPMAILCGALYAFTFNVKNGYFGFGKWSIPVPEFLTYRSRLYVFGFIDQSYAALDYFPLLPHLFLFLGAAFLGCVLLKKELPAFCYKKVPFLSFLGKHSLLIYLVHQPVCYGIIYLAAMLTGRV